MTIRTPAAPARFALLTYERPEGVNPPLDYPPYRGLLGRLVTRIYFPDERAANRADPVLRAIADPGRRATLVAAAQPGPPGGLRFDIRLQRDHETVFLDV
jgi:hypothetical protein